MRTTVSTNRPLPSLLPDGERELVAYLTQTAKGFGVGENSADIVNLYVSLKSKPLLILTGPAQSGKIAAIQHLAGVLLAKNVLQCQMMLGHPWWVGNSEKNDLFTRAQSRYNTEKLLNEIEEAWQPGNIRRVYLACLMRISPVEMINFFKKMAFQIRHGELINFGEIHLSEPVPYPANLFLIGTMDTSLFSWWDNDLLPVTTILQWPEDTKDIPSDHLERDPFPAGEKIFLSSIVRNETTVYHKIRTILKRNLPSRWAQPMQPLFKIGSILEKNAVPLPTSIINEAMVYLANAWSGQGYGLFDPSATQNLAIALDYAIAQIVLPRVREPVWHSVSLYKQMKSALGGQFPRSAGLLDNIA